MRFFIYSVVLFTTTSYAANETWQISKPIDLVRPKPNDDYKTLNITKLSDFNFQPNSQLNETALPIIGQETPSSSAYRSINSDLANSLQNNNLNYESAILIAIKRHPSVTQAIAQVSGQNANIDVARAAYYPQISGGLETGDFTSSSRGEQIYTIKATQLLYDFGKVKSSVDIQKAKLIAQQATVLSTIDDIATETSRDIIALQYYRNLVKIAQEQVSGMQRLYNIALLRSKAGISSHADPIQALSYVNFAQSYLITQQSNVRQTEEKIRVLLGFDVSNITFNDSKLIIQPSHINDQIAFNQIPKMIISQAEIAVASAQKQQTKTSLYPTISLVGSVTKALDGENPTTGRRNGTDSAVYLSASSNFYQGGQVRSQMKSANYAEQAAQAALNATYLNVLNTTRTAKELIENTQRQIAILIEREQTTARTRELYEDQYKLGTRSIFDLVSAEQSYHSSRIDKEQATYNIYDTLAQYINSTGQSRDAYHLNNLDIQGIKLRS